MDWNIDLPSMDLYQWMDKNLILMHRQIYANRWIYVAGSMKKSAVTIHMKAPSSIVDSITEYKCVYHNYYKSQSVKKYLLFFKTSSSRRASLNMYML